VSPTDFDLGKKNNKSMMPFEVTWPCIMEMMYFSGASSQAANYKGCKSLQFNDSGKYH